MDFLWARWDFFMLFILLIYFILFHFVSCCFTLFCFILFCFVLFYFTLPEITSRRPDRPLGLYAITYSYLIYHLIFHWLLFPTLLLFLFASNISYISSEHYHFTVPTYFSYWLVNYLIHIPLLPFDFSSSDGPDMIPNSFLQLLELVLTSCLT